MKMSSQAQDFFRPWNSEKKAEEEEAASAAKESFESKLEAAAQDSEECDSESESLAGSSSSYNSVDSERSLRRRASSAGLDGQTVAGSMAAIALPALYPTAQPAVLPPQPAWDSLGGVRLEEAIYFNGIAAEVDRINQQEFVARQIKKTRPKNFSCHYCPAAFSNNGQLKGHLRTHTGEKPFRCNAEGCSRAFTRNEELTRHKRIHTGLKPYVCDLCHKKFGRKDHLKKHFKTHNRYPSAADYDFAYMASLLTGHYYGYYPAVANANFNAYPFDS